MHVVAIHDLKKDKESLAGDLAGVLGLTLFEALKRLRSPGNGPLVVAVLAEDGPAEQLADRLRSAGFRTAVLTAGEIEAESGAGIVKRFSLGERELSGTTEKGDGFSIPFQNIDLILRGTAISSDSKMETTKSRSLSPGRAVLSGGLFLTKTTKSVREVTTEERQGFVNIYAMDAPTLTFRESTLIHDSPGQTRMLSRAENFVHLISELRNRCPGSRYDERLLGKAAQAALLGPFLDPEKYLCVATALLAKVLRGKA